MKKILIVFLLVIFNFSVNRLFSQITISPPAAVIDPKVNSGMITITNTSDVKKEIIINPKFGYIDYDSTGNPYIKLDGFGLEAAHSLEPYLKIIPNKFFIEPGGKQIVRFLAVGAEEAPDRAYFTRIIINANNAEVQIDDSNTGSGINVNTEINSMAIYPKGQISCNLEIIEAYPVMDSGSSSLFVRLKKFGNTPFLGTMSMEIFNNDGEKVDEISDYTFAAYFDCLQQVKLSGEQLAPGKYTAKIKIELNRAFPEILTPETDVIENNFDFFIK